MNFKLVAIHSSGTEDSKKQYPEEKEAKPDFQRNKAVHSVVHFKL